MLTVRLIVCVSDSTEHCFINDVTEDLRATVSVTDFLGKSNIRVKDELVPIDFGSILRA